MSSKGKISINICIAVTLPTLKNQKAGIPKRNSPLGAADDRNPDLIPLSKGMLHTIHFSMNKIG